MRFCLQQSIFRRKKNISVIETNFKYRKPVFEMKASLKSIIYMYILFKCFHKSEALLFNNLESFL